MRGVGKGWLSPPIDCLCDKLTSIIPQIGMGSGVLDVPCDLKEFERVINVIKLR